MCNAEFAPLRRILLTLLAGCAGMALLLAAGCGATLPTMPVVSLTPAAVTLQAGTGTQQFAAKVTNASNTLVVWKVNGVMGGSASDGLITQAGLYTAPAAVPTSAVQVEAVSVSNATAVAEAAVTITAGGTVQVTPATASVGAGQTQQFTATVTNEQNTGVTWSVNGTAGGSSAVGTISASGLYTAPATFPGVSQITITAASVADPSLSGTAAVTLAQPVAVAVTPASPTVNLGATQSFAAAVTGTTNTAVNWSVDGVAGGNATVGTINAQGVYTAPLTLPASAQETITATSQAENTATGTATVTLQTPPAQFSLSPSAATLTLGKAASGAVSFQVSVSPGLGQTIQFAASGLPPNVTASFTPASVTASGTVQLTLTTGSISLAATAVPITLTASATGAGGGTMTQQASVALTITGWAGHVRTLAGGPGGVGFEDGTGTADELDPVSVVSDGGQTVYFADKRGTALRSLNLGNQTVTTLIGGPYSYTIGEGDGIAYDGASGTLYIADALRNRIDVYKVGAYNDTVLAGGDIAGHADGVGAAASFDYPHGLALSPDGTTLYVADTNNELIRAVNTATGAVTTVAGQYGVYRSTDGAGTAATFCQPTGLAMAPGGADLYVSDQCGYVIRQIALPGAVVTTVAGTGAVGEADGPAGSATFSDLRGLATDPHAGANLVYIVDGNAIRALKLGASAAVFTLAGAAANGQADGAGAGASFYDPNAVAAVADVAGSGTTTLYVADSDNGLLRQLVFQNPLSATSAATATVNVTTIAGQPSHRGSSDGVGTGAGYTGTSVATLSQPEGIVTDGKIAYVADAWNGAIREIDLATTQVTTVAGPHQGYADGPAAQAAFYQPAGLAWVPSQNVIYIADTGNGAIRKLDLGTGMVSTVAGTDASGYVDGTLAQARFNHPFGILASPDGTKLYVADAGNNAIRLIDLTAGTVSTIAGSGALGNADGIGTAARFAEPNGLAFDSTGKNIYISDFENQAIRELNLQTGAVTTVVGQAHVCGYADGPAGTASLCDPAFLTTDGRSLFWGDLNTGLLRVLNLTTMQVATVAGSPGLLHMQDGDLTETPGELTGPVRYNGVFGVALAPDDSFLLFTDKTANVVRILY